jgi:hypothetical protein
VAVTKRFEATLVGVASWVVCGVARSRSRDGANAATAPAPTAREGAVAPDTGGFDVTNLNYTCVVRPLASSQTNLRVAWSLLWAVKRVINVQELLQEAK